MDEKKRERLYTTRQTAEIINKLTHTTSTDREVDQAWIRERVNGKRAVRETPSGKYIYQRTNLLRPGFDYSRIAGRVFLTTEGIRRLVEERREQLHNPNNRNSRYWERLPIQ